MRAIPTLHIERIDYTEIGGSHAWVILATSYGRTEPSGLGEFGTREEAEAAMKRLAAHLEQQRGKKEPKRR